MFRNGGHGYGAITKALMEADDAAFDRVLRTVSPCRRSCCWVHIAAQLAFLAAIAVHVGLVLRHTVLRRDGELRRML